MGLVHVVNLWVGYTIGMDNNCSLFDVVIDSTPMLWSVRARYMLSAERRRYFLHYDFSSLSSGAIKYSSSNSTTLAYVIILHVAI
jgi:hypothetical protein